MPNPTALGLAALSFALMPLTALPGQCQTTWQPGPELHGVWGEQWFHAGRAITAWDPDGPGPATELIVVGGEFSAAGGAITPGIAAFDPATDTWEHLGSTLSGEIEVLTVLADGRLAAGGAMMIAGIGHTAFAVFDGTSWSRLGGSTVGFRVHAIINRSNGNIVAAGSTTYTHEWDGTSWQRLGVLNGNVEALIELPSGDLVAAGNVWVGATNSGAAIWDGTNWTAMPNTPRPLHALALLPNGTMIAGGLINYPGLRGVVQWTGTGWATLGNVTGPNSRVRGLIVESNGDVIAGGDFTTTGSGSGRHVARWNGSTWATVGTTEVGAVYALARLGNGNLAAAARFNSSGRGGAWVFDGTDWSIPGDGISGSVTAVTARDDGTFVIAGDFRIQQGTTLIEDLAEWDGTSWSSMAGGTNGPVYALATLPNGHVVAGGSFSSAGGVPARFVSIWTGIGWIALAADLSGPPRALLPLENGRFLASGAFLYAGNQTVNGIAAWNGRYAWDALGSGVGPIYSSVNAMAKLPNGDVIVGGAFSSAGGVAAENVARWDGQNWSPVGAGLTHSPVGVVHDLWTAPNGELLAGGLITASGSSPLAGLARWNGQAWNAFAPDNHFDVYDLAWLPNGDMAAVGGFTTIGGVAANHAARWNGSSWSELDGGLDGFAYDLETIDGHMTAFGGFGRAGSVVAARITHLKSNCPALATSVGAPCPGSAGPLTLAPTTLPRVGDTFEATAGGLVPGSLAVALLGLQSPAIPLASLHPAGVANCDLLASSESVELFVVSNSTYLTSWTLPNNPAFVGLPIWHQILQAELDPAQQLTRLAGTNALALVIGLL